MTDPELSQEVSEELHHTDPDRWQARILAALEQVRKDEREACLVLQLPPLRFAGALYREGFWRGVAEIRRRIRARGDQT